MVPATSGGASRKEKRKRERQEKKQRRSKAPRHATDANERQRQAQGDSHKPRRVGRSSAPASGREGRRGNGANGAIVNRFHELVQETTGRSMQGEKQEMSAEDAKIKALEAKLGLGSSSSKADGTKRLQREYSKDGLGDDFAEFLSSLDNISALVKERKKPTSKATATVALPKRGRIERVGEELVDSDNAADSENDGSTGEGQDEDVDEDEFGSDMEMDEDTRRELELLRQEDADFLRGMDELPTDESELDSDEDLAAFESEEEDDDVEGDDDGVLANTLRNAQGASIASDEEVSDSDGGDHEDEVDDDQEHEDDDHEEEEDGDDNDEAEESEPEIKEDIYGRPVLVPRDSAKKPSAYVPPHLRRQMQEAAAAAASGASTSSSSTMPVVSSTMDEQAIRELTRRVNGQLNRISESNMESICLEMEKIYREHGRSFVNTILLDKLVQTSVHPSQVMTPLVKICGALVAALFHSVGTEIGGFFVEKFVLQLVEAVDEAKAETREGGETNDDDVGQNSAVAEEEPGAVASKKPANLLLLVAVLYNLGVVQCTLIYDLFRRFVDQFTAVDIELTHHLLKSCGHQLRSDDPDALRDMVRSVQEKVAAVTATAGGSGVDERVRFILDLILDLKKPGKQARTAKKQNGGRGMTAATLDVSSLKKWIGRVKTRSGQANNALRLSLHELLHAEQDGRWWIVGGTWVGYQQAKGSNAANSDNAVDRESDAQQNRLLALAEKQRMNTDVRKRIFVALMGAADCVDAYERVLQLHLREKQEREVVRVLLHCCGQEKRFNRYYLALASKCCEMDPRFKFTFQLAFWDTFKQLGTLPARRLYNLAQLLAGLVINGSLSLSVLKVLDFTSLNINSVLFLRIVLEQIFKLEDEKEMAGVFERVLQTKKAPLTLDGLAVFLHQHVTSFKRESDPTTRRLLSSRCKQVKSLLDTLSKATVNADASKEFM